MTGLGVCSPIGVGEESFFAALESGRSGVAVDEEGAKAGFPLSARIGEFGFGRIDFDIGGGRPEIWECNTNPVPAVASFSAQGGRSERIIPRGWQQLRDALALLDNEAAHAVTVEIEPVARYEDLYRDMLNDVRERANLPPPE